MGEVGRPWEVHAGQSGAAAAPRTAQAHEYVRNAQQRLEAAALSVRHGGEPFQRAAARAIQRRSEEKSLRTKINHSGTRRRW